MSDSKKPTLADVARQANVSPATASRALHGGKDRVCTDTIAHIRAVADLLGYARRRRAPEFRSANDPVGWVVVRKTHVIQDIACNTVMDQRAAAEQCHRFNSRLNARGEKNVWIVIALVPVGRSLDMNDGTEDVVSDRCELTDLIKDQCAHCRKLTAPPLQLRDLSRPLRSIVAGMCGDCGAPFAEGDRIRYDREENVYVARCCWGDQ